MDSSDVASTSSNIIETLSPTSAFNKQLKKLCDIRKIRRASKKVNELIEIGLFLFTVYPYSHFPVPSKLKIKILVFFFLGL